MISIKRRIFNALTHYFSDEHYFQILHFLKLKKIPNIREPKTFNEKILWRIVFDKKEIFSQLTDKVGMREYIKELGLEAYLPTAYFIGNNPIDIPFKELPKSFVVKPNHASGRVIFVYDKNDLNKEELINTCKTWLAFSYYERGREWPYKNIKPKIIVEELLGDHSKICVYKYHCFHGQPKLIAVGKGYLTDQMKFAVYDTRWRKQDIDYSRSRKADFPSPKNLPKMLELSARVSKQFDYIRVDFYDINNRVLISELTFTASSGMYPRWGKLNRIMGHYWNIDMLPISKQSK